MDEPTNETQETKSGARNSVDDRKRIRDIRAKVREIHDITVQLEPKDSDEPNPIEELLGKSVDGVLVNFGSEIKLLGETPEGARIGGYLVRFSTAEDPDLTGDYFTKDTDFGFDPEDRPSVPIYFNHGQPIKTRENGEILITRRIGKGQLQLDDVGVLIDAIIYNRDEYERAISEQAKSLGWSSGALGHLVEREWGHDYHDPRRIKRWPIGEGSLTPTPAEPRNSAIPLKSLLPQAAAQVGETTPTATDEAASDPTISTVTPSTGVKTMEITPEVQELLDAAAKKGAEEAIKGLPTNGTGGVAVVADEADRALKGNPFKSFGEQLKAVVDAAQDGATPDKRLLALKQLGMNEGIPSEGGFLVQKDFTSELLKRTYELGVLASRIRRIPISANANGLKMNAVAESSRVRGSRWGGVRAYWLGEAGTKLPSAPAFRQMALDLKKLIGLCYSTDELLQDTSALESIMMQAFSEEFAYEIDDAIYRGVGAGLPLGILNSPALVTVAAEPAQPIDTVVHENVVNMWSRMWGRSRANAIWVYNQDIEPQLYTMGLAVGGGGTPSFMPPGGLSGAPYATLFGRPAIPLEQASTLGDVGDIALLDLSQYIGIDKGGMQTASSIHVQFLTDQTAFRFVYRFDGQPAWVAPLTPATGSANTLSPFVVLAAR